MTFSRNRSLLIAAVLIAGGCSRPTASISVTPTPWSEGGLVGRRFETEHFRLHSTLADAEFERALPGFLEAAYRRYEETLPAPASDVKLITYAFGTRSQWEQFTRRRFPMRADLYARIRCGGFTEEATAALFYSDRSSTLATLAHEGWHQYVGARFKQPVPAWLNEGLACYHESVEWSGASPTFTPARNAFRINALREGIQAKRLLPLREIIDTDAGEILARRQPEVTQTYYAQTWALVTFLWHGADGRYTRGFARLLTDVADGSYRIHAGAARLSASEGSETSLSAAALESCFGATPQALEPEYQTFLLKVAGF